MATCRWLDAVQDWHLFEHFVTGTLAPTRSAFFPQTHALAGHDLQSSGTAEAWINAGTAQAMNFYDSARAL